MAGYSHRISHIGFDHYRLSWSYDHHYADSVLRYPRRVRRDTDRKGAERFAKKWNLEIPVKKP